MRFTAENAAKQWLSLPIHFVFFASHHCGDQLTLFQGCVAGAGVCQSTQD